MALFARTRIPFGQHTAIADIRAHYASLFERFGAPATGVHIEPAQLGVIKGEWIRLPNSAPRRLILYFHGGGYLAGSPETHRPLIIHLCRAAQASALSVAYRLAPECPFPSAVRDGVDVYRRLITSGVAPESIVLAGDEAGGGLAFAVALAIRNGGMAMPAGIAALSPWADISLSGWSMMENASHDAQLNWDLLFLCARHYLKRMNPIDPYASVVFGNFKDFPAVMVHAGSHEILRDDASKLGDRAAESGVPVNIEVYDGMPHLFQADMNLREARTSIARLGQFIQHRMRAPAMPVEESEEHRELAAGE